MQKGFHKKIILQDPNNAEAHNVCTLYANAYAYNPLFPRVIF